MTDPAPDILAMPATVPGELPESVSCEPAQADIIATSKALAAEVRNLRAEVRGLREQLRQPQRRWLSVDDAAVYSGISADSIRRLLAAGKLVAHRPMAGRVVICIRELDSFIAGSTSTPRNRRGIGAAQTNKRRATQ